MNVRVVLQDSQACLFLYLLFQVIVSLYFILRVCFGFWVALQTRSHV